MNVPHTYPKNIIATAEDGSVYIFKSVSQAADELLTTRHSIIKHCYNGKPFKFGFTVKFAED